jgi:hypothetical protein
VVLTKSETIDVQEAREPQGLRAIDPAHDLMPGASVDGAARAFEFHDAWTLAAKATRYQLEEIKGTSIERALLRMVVTRGNQLSVQALYRMRSAEQRLAVQLPAQIEFDTEPLRINGRRVALERGAQDVFQVPLVGQNPDAPFVLEIRYTVPSEGKRLDFPVFPSNPAVQQVELSAYLPSEQVCVGTSGPWTDDFDWRSDAPFQWRPVPRQGDAELVRRVTEGIDVAGDPNSSFPTDGRRLTFSTLRPDPPPDGAIKLKTMNEKWLHFYSLAAVVLIGLLLTPMRGKSRVAVTGVVAIAVVLLAVFQPMLVLAVLNGALVGAIVVVLIIWFGWFAVRSGASLWNKPLFSEVATAPDTRRSDRRGPRAAASPPATPPAASPPTAEAHESPFQASDLPPPATGAAPPEPSKEPDQPSGGEQHGGSQT